MLTFSQFLKEAGDTALPFKYDGEHDEYDQRYHRYSFINDGRKYRVNFAHHDMPHPVAIVNFADYTDRDFGDQYMTGRAKHSAVKVMSTVHNIIKHHLSKHPEIEEVHFSSSPDEPSRGRLYSRYTEKHGGITDPTAYDTNHVIPAQSYRLSEGFLNEVGEYKVPFRHRHFKNTPIGDIHEYEVGVNNTRFGIDVSDGPKRGTVEVAFGDSDHNIEITGNQRYSASKVLSAIHHVIKHHAVNNPAVSEFTFTAPKTEPSRVKLYQKYARKQEGSWSNQPKHVSFSIPADSYRRMNEAEEQPVRIKLGMPKGEQAQNFMVDFVDSSDEHPFNPAARILHGSVVHASRDGNQVHIHDIQTLAPKSGAGTKALKHLTSLADKHGVKLNLFAKAYSNRPEHIRSTPKLIKWYERHGFKHDEPDYDPDYGSEMTYYPK